MCTVKDYLDNTSTKLLNEADAAAILKYSNRFFYRMECNTCLNQSIPTKGKF
jgi:hypothetical protein